MSDGKVIDFVSKRKESIEEKKRTFERVVFDNFLGCYSVLDEFGSIFPLNLIDISEDGCLFQIPLQKGIKKVFKTGSDINLRLYFTEKSYLPLPVEIKYGRLHNENGEEYMRYGCQFDRTTSGYDALLSFINFINKYSENSIADKDGRKVYYL